MSSWEVANRFRKIRGALMGGFGSGRPRQRATVEACEVLDVNALNRSFALPAPPQDETWIRFQVRDVNRAWHTRTQFLRIDRVPRHYGGTQPYFICSCGRRAVKLYRGYGFYRCRRCHHLAYKSQCEDAFARAQHSAHKIMHRLGGGPDWLAPFPPKPKGMQQQTYERLWDRYLEAVERADAAFELQAAAIMRWASPLSRSRS